ncbi:MAG: dihydroorotase [Phycisphaerae bacterium]|nr:dihydroorotase [Phycisphaerae bacterium]
MPNILIRGGRVIDPASGADRVADVALADGKVAAVAPFASLPRSPADHVIDAEGCLVTPGLIDPHVHLREPGFEDKETLATGTRAAVFGGFTTVCCMPNTSPALDLPELLGFIRERARETALCRVFPVAAITKGRHGEELAELALMARAGAVGFSDDGDCVGSTALMARALADARPTGLAIMQHAQDVTLTRGAPMHAGVVSARLGLAGWPRVAEEVIVERDIRLNRSIGCRYHVQHVSSEGTVEIIRRARADGQPITGEASPHHLLLTDEACDGYNTAAKVNPPLREWRDVRALREGVADGTITLLGTDHAPHTADEKLLPFEEAPFGLVGLDTALPLYAEALVDSGAIDWPRLVALLTIEPARLCGLDALGLGSLALGGPADVTIIDPGLSWTVAEADLSGKGRNTPFLGRAVRGRAVATIVAGVVRLARRPVAAP